MKKLLFSLMLLGVVLSSNAQKFSENALGLRLGSNDGVGYEISYQRGLEKTNRIEADLGWRNSNNVSSFKLVGLYQWIWELDKGFNWYAGVGGGFGCWNYNYNGASSSGTVLLVAGDVGVEYNFDIPLQVSLDFRPEMYFNSSAYRNSSFGPDIALSVRYRF